MIPDESLRVQFTRRLDAHGMDVFNSLSMSAATIAYQECSTWLIDLKDYLRANIAKLELFVETELPAVKFVAPQAGYLAWLDCRTLKLTDAELEQKFVSAGLVPSMGIAFGKEGSGFVRLNLGCPAGTLDEALVRIKHALS